MENSVNIVEKVWATLDRIGERLEKSSEEAEKRRVEFEQSLEKSRAEAEKRNAEAEKRRVEFEQSLEKSRAEAEKRNAEAEKRRVEFEQSLEKSRAEAEKRNAEFERSLEKSRAEAEKRNAEFDRKMKELSEQIGGMGNSNGAYAEEFFYNALYNGQRIMFGEVFDDVMKSSKVTFNKGFEDEYDILLVNGRAVCIVEVKYKADSSDLPRQVLRKAQTFRVNFPQYKDKAIYLALAAMTINPLTEQACKENGIAIMKQAGETMVITDENLKTF